MDLAPCVDENDTPFLIDSGTESITESPLDTEHSEDSTVCDIKISKSWFILLIILSFIKFITLDTSKTKANAKLSTSLIDKSFSIDEDELCTPLEPTQVGIFHLTPSVTPNSVTPEEITSEEDDGIEDIIHIDVDKACLEAQQEKITEDHVKDMEENSIEVVESEDEKPSHLVTIVGMYNSTLLVM